MPGHPVGWGDYVERLGSGPNGCPLARSLGAPCEGPPGERFPGFYAAYFRDPDGNKLNAFIMG